MSNICRLIVNEIESCVNKCDASVDVVWAAGRFPGPGGRPSLTGTRGAWGISETTPGSSPVRWRDGRLAAEAGGGEADVRGSEAVRDMTRC